MRSTTRWRRSILPALGLVLAACTTTVDGTATRTTPSSGPSRSNPSLSPAPTVSGDPAKWRAFVRTAALTTHDLTPGWTSRKAPEGPFEKACPSLHAVADTRTGDVAYHRVRFTLGTTTTSLDEVIAVTGSAAQVFADFASTASRCAHYRSTASNGDVVRYTVRPVQVGTLGAQAAAIDVEGVARDASGDFHVGSTIVVFRSGPVLVQVNSESIPPPPVALATTVAAIAARRLAEHKMP